MITMMIPLTPVNHVDDERDVGDDEDGEDEDDDLGGDENDDDDWN